MDHDMMTKGMGVLPKGPEVLFPLAMAPMVALSHVVLRECVRDYLPENINCLWPTEMLSSRRLPNEKIGQVAELQFSPRDHQSFLVPQILGNEEKFIAPSLKKIEEFGARGVDINMGCPVKKILKHNHGVALMGDADYAARVVEITAKNTSLPVSVKLRTGVDRYQEEEFISFLKKIESAGAQWVTIHPRLGIEKRRGRAKWELLDHIQKQIRIPIYGNGDIQCLNDVKERLGQTNVPVLVVGRAMTARPWLFRQYLESIDSSLEKIAPQSPEEEAQEYARFLLKSLDYYEQYFDETKALKLFKFMTRHGSVWLEFGNYLQGTLTSCQNFEQIRKSIHHFFATPQKMMQRTQLRL